MPLLSAFTPCGMLACSSKPSHAEAIYHSLLAGLNGDGARNYDVAEGSRTDAWAYATAMCLARAQYALEAAAHEADSRRVQYFLAEREAQYKLVPGAQDDFPARQARVTAARHAPGGGSASNVTAALQALLGADFRALRYTKPAEVATWPAAIGDQPMSLQLPTVPLKVFKTLRPVSLLGSQAVRYTRPSGFAISQGYQSKLIPGDVVVVSADDPSLAERVVVTAVGVEADVFDTFTAAFAMAHEPGATLTSGDYPAWVSTQRQFLVVLTPAAARDPERRRRVHELLDRLVRGTSTWAIVEETAPGHAGPFLIGVSPLGPTTVGDVTFP